MSNADELRQRAVQSQKANEDGNVSPAADSKVEDEEPLAAENVSGMLRNSRTRVCRYLFDFVLSKNDYSSGGAGHSAFLPFFFQSC